VLIDSGHHAGVFRTLSLAPDLAPAHEQTLLGREAVNRLLRRVTQNIQQSHIGNSQPTVVCSILAQRQLPANVNVIHRDETVILLDEACLQLVELFTVFGSPPITQVSLGIKLAAGIVESVRQFVADNRADGAEVYRIVDLGIVEMAAAECRLES
jgi:hypothetical protein